MKRIHIAFFGVPYPPHVNPTLPIVSVLVRRGYRVTYVTSDLFESRISSSGAEVILCSRHPVRVTDGSLDESEDKAFFHLAVATLQRVRPFYRENKPDLIVYDWLALAGRILAEELNIPAIQMSVSFAQDRRFHGEQLKDPGFRQHELENSQLFDRFLRKYGVESNGFIFHREKLNLYLFPKFLQPPGDVFGTDCFYAGRCAGEQPYYGGWRNTWADDTAVALVSTSTTYVQGAPYFKACVSALADMQWRGILSIGDSGDPASMGPLPEKFEIVQHNSHIKILPYIDLFICLGGIVTMSEAAYHGVPLVVASRGFPELEWQAERMSGIGMGVWIHEHEITADGIKAAITGLLQDQLILAKVKELRRTVRSEPGGEETANRIEEYLETWT